jgi:hypothetical protein
VAYSDNKTSVNCAKNEKANKNAIKIIKIIFRPKNIHPKTCHEPPEGK